MTEATFDATTKELGDKIVGLTLLQAKALSDYLKQVHGIEPASGGVIRFRHHLIRGYGRGDTLEGHYSLMLHLEMLKQHPPPVGPLLLAPCKRRRTCPGWLPAASENRIQNAFRRPALRIHQWNLPSS